VLLYFGIALVGVLFLVVTAIFGEVMDVLNLDDGTHPLSGKVIATALTAFGAAGMIARYAGLSAGFSALVAALVAVLMAAVVWWGTNALYRQTASTDVIVSTMRGRLAEVTINIPTGSVGEVLLTAANGTKAMIARSANGEPIPAGSTVRIVETVGNTVIVEPLAAAHAREVTASE
jgi:membrane-bound ClpP family serine protease